MESANTVIVVGGAEMGRNILECFAAGNIVRFWFACEMGAA
jgi:hypothetical protein